MPTPDPRAVFVIHGRNRNARRALFAFLRAIDLNPLEWSQLVTATGNPNPFIGEVLAKGFELAQAAIVLATPDDEARLKMEFWQDEDSDAEKEINGQPRQNVLFEAGMALASHDGRTVVVELGRLRPMSDMLGRHVLRLNNSPAMRQELANRLRAAGCSLKLDGTDWHNEGDFEAAVAAEAVPESTNEPNKSEPALSSPVTKAVNDASSARQPTLADFVNLGEHLWYLSNPPRAHVNNVAATVRGFLNQLNTCNLPATRAAATLLAQLQLSYDARTNLITDASLRQLEAMMAPVRDTLAWETAEVAIKSK